MPVVVVLSLLFVMFAAWWMVSTQMATALSPFAQLRLGSTLGWLFLLLALWSMRFAWGAESGVPLGILVFALTALALIHFKPRGLTYSRVKNPTTARGLRQTSGQSNGRVK